MCTENLDYIDFVCFFFFLSFFLLPGERHLILGTAKKGILTLKYGSKDMLLWKRGSVFVSTEDENLGESFQTGTV